MPCIAEFESSLEMPGQTPVRTCTRAVGGLGHVTGLEYVNGVSQFCGIPYATLTKRWTRSVLCEHWQDAKHDGTKLGANAPSPFAADSDSDLVPVPAFSTFDQSITDEKSALVANIVVPANVETAVPVMVYVHGGSLLYGGANLAIFDAVNLVSRSMKLGKPIIVVNFNYRVGLGGFLASQAIEKELARDGFSGCGNFGLTDQQVAFEWIRRFIGSFGGDPARITCVGESAGGISISHHLLARKQPPFQRAISMSGLSCAIPSWTRAKHEKLFAATCRHFGIDPDSVNCIEELRRIPEQELADQTPSIQGVASGTGNPCLDGDFHAKDPNTLHRLPEWLDAYVVGDTYHEGIIFRWNILEDDYQSCRSIMLQHVGDVAALDQVLGWYGIEAGVSDSDFRQRFEHLAGDFVFKIPNFATVKLNRSLSAQSELFGYHFDRRSRLRNSLEGTSYHAIDLLYLFGNLNEAMNEEEKAVTEQFSKAWIDFIYGDAPWDKQERHWMRWPESGTGRLVSEREDEDIRNYERMGRVLDLGRGETWQQIFKGIDAIVNKRMRMGTMRPLR